MADRSLASVHVVAFAILVLGFGGFVALHTALLFSGNQPMLRLVRPVWLGGLGLALALGVALTFGAPRPFRG